MFFMSKVQYQSYYRITTIFLHKRMIHIDSSFSFCYTEQRYFIETTPSIPDKELGRNLLCIHGKNYIILSITVIAVNFAKLVTFPLWAEEIFSLVSNLSQKPLEHRKISREFHLSDLLVNSLINYFLLSP